jgi:hypothetical protein
MIVFVAPRIDCSRFVMRFAAAPYERHDRPYGSVLTLE